MGQPGIVGELRFPAMEVYPTFTQYKQMEGNFPKLTSINYKQENNVKYLSGIQLGFADDTVSPMIEAENAVGDEVKTIEIDALRIIGAISMKTVYSRNIEGLRLYDEEMELIIDVTWDEDAILDGEWTEPQSIPSGQ